MAVEAEVKKIGGSYFARIPPELARSLDLRPDDLVWLDVRRVGATVDELLKLRGKYPTLPAFDRNELWGE